MIIKGISYKEMDKDRKKDFVFIILIILFVVCFILDILLGSVNIKPADVIHALFGNADTGVETIILRFRIPKALTALAAGIALSVSGLQMQTLFRNPMAGPYVLGVSSGASLGVALVVLGFSTGLSAESIQNLGNWILVVAAWLGAGAVMLLIMVISARIKDIMIILIIGIMLASGISSIVSIMQYFSNETLLKAYVIWTMGSLGNISADQLNILLVSVILGMVLSLISVKMLNALLLGENYASSIGLNYKMARMLIFLCTSILAGSVTAFCGPIGFIGLAVPHISRNLFRTSDHRVLVPATILCGAIMMLVSDIISQLPGSAKVLPINSITSLIGIPVVIWIILRNKRQTGIF